MSLEDIKSVRATEEKAAALRVSAQAEAKKLIAEAENQGKAYADRSRTDAEEKVRHLLTEAEETARKNSADRRTEFTKQCSALASAADSRLDEAAAKIVERIVNA